MPFLWNGCAVSPEYAPFRQIRATECHQLQNDKFQYLYTGWESSRPVFSSWHFLYRARQLFLSQNRFGAPRCGTIYLPDASSDVSRNASVPWARAADTPGGHTDGSVCMPSVIPLYQKPLKDCPSEASSSFSISSS